MGFLRYFLICTFGFGHLWEETYCDSAYNLFERPYRMNFTSELKVFTPRVNTAETIQKQTQCTLKAIISRTRSVYEFR